MFGRATISLGIGPHSSFNGFRVFAALLHGTQLECRAVTLRRRYNQVSLIAELPCCRPIS